MAAPEKTARLKGLSKVFFISFFVWILLVTAWANLHLGMMQSRSPQSLPFGVFLDSNGVFYAQDFSYNVLFLKGVKERIVSDPYVPENQEKLMRHMAPSLNSGLGHAYSPVAFVLLLPILDLPGQTIYLIYTILGAAGTLLLLYFYLLPRAESQVQLYAIAMGVIGVCLTAAFATGQSTLITTPTLAAFWALLRKKAPANPVRDSLIAFFFWVLCLKPNVAMIPFFLLLGARNWRALGIGAILLLLTWTATAGYYGGWWTGLQDYLTLLSRYEAAHFPAFIRRDDDSAITHFLSAYDHSLPHHLFVLNRTLFTTVNLALILARWCGRITASEHFQGAVWAFLLVSPYLLGSEYWVLVLLITEGSFFAVNTPFSAALKLFLLFGIVYLRLGVNSPVDFNFPCKWLLFFWIATKALLERLRREEWPGSEPQPAENPVS
jgi:hypothetical protein